MVDSTDLFGQGGDDTRRQEALRQFGRSLPNSEWYERDADTILSVLRTRIERRSNGCWSWTGETYATVGQKRIKLDPRLLVWVACAAAKSNHSLALWPTCDLQECIRPEHQLEVVPLTTATVELCFQIGELNEGIVKAALRKGGLRRVESPHYPRARVQRNSERMKPHGTWHTAPVCGG